MKKYIIWIFINIMYYVILYVILSIIFRIYVINFFLFLCQEIFSIEFFIFSSSKSTVNNEFLGCIKNKNLYVRMLLNLCGIEDKEFSTNKAFQKKINMTLFYIQL